MPILNEYGQPWTFAHAADRSYRRGPQFAVRDDDIDRLIPSNDRRTLASLSNRLFMNMGVPRACIVQKSDCSVGEAWLPTYIGPDTDKGRGVAAFMRDVWMHQCSTKGGIFDWWKMLKLASIGIDRGGDVFWVMIKGADNFPRIQEIPSHRCYSKATEKKVESGPWKGYRICDGIIYYRGGMPAAYRFNVGTDGDEVMKDIPASDVIHLFDPTHCEQGRGLPAFTHALEGLKMSLFSTEDERIRQQIISRLHLTIFNESGGPDLDDPANSITPATATNPAMVSQNFPGGVYYAANGDRIEQMRHDNPGPIWDSFQDRMIRDAVLPNWSFSVWKSTGQGTAERGEVLKCRQFVRNRQEVLWYAARRAMSWAYSVFAESGRFSNKLASPAAWDFSRPPRLSVDDGRESKMELDELVTGSRNLAEVLEARGLTEEQFLTQRAWSVANRKAIARRVSKEASAKYGEEIEIEDREMFMLTPNEMGSQESPEKSTTNQEDPEE